MIVNPLKSETPRLQPRRFKTAPPIHHERKEMSHSNSTATVAPRKVRHYQAWCCEVEDLASLHGVKFSTLITPDDADSPPSMDMRINLLGHCPLDGDFDLAEIADAYRQFCDHYAKKLTSLSAALKARFPQS